MSVAPMMDWTDRHCRYFHRLLTQHTLLYTEMVNAGAIIHGGTERHLRFNAEEHPVALQLGGSEPAPRRVSGANGIIPPSQGRRPMPAACPAHPFPYPTPRALPHKPMAHVRRPDDGQLRLTNIHAGLRVDRVQSVCICFSHYENLM